MASTSLNWVRSDWRAALHEGPGGAGWQEAQQESEVCAWAAQGANHVLGWIKQSFTSHFKEGIILLYLVLVWPHPECCVCFWAPQFQKDVKVPECIQRKAQKLWMGLAGRPVRSSSGLKFSCLERRSLRGNLTGLYNFLGRGRGKGPSFPWDPMVGHVGMAKSCAPQKKFRLDMRKHFFT